MSLMFRFCEGFKQVANLNFELCNFILKLKFGDELEEYDNMCNIFLVIKVEQILCFLSSLSMCLNNTSFQGQIF